MRLLCLDLATRIGWACGSLEGEPISHGIWKLSETDEDIGRLMFQFRRWLCRTIVDTQATEILFESPILTKNTTIAALRKLYSLAAMAEFVAFDHEMPIHEASLSSIRTHFIGVTCAPKTMKGGKRRRDWLKDKLIGECRARGFHVADDNDADALALLSYGISLKRPGFRLEAVTAGAAA